MRLLVIENDDRIVNFIRRGLVAEGYGVDIAKDGQQGLDLGRGDYHLIILDLMLPYKSGSEICQELRLDQVKPPILMLTAKDSIQDKVQGFQAGADDYLTKPFAFEELLARIRALLRRTPSARPVPELKVANLSLNRETHEVRRGDKLIPLTLKQFTLLEYLMSYPHKALSRSMLLEQVWGYHYDTHTNVVDVCIQHLRKKVDTRHIQKLIHTVRDVGYKISDQP